MHEFYLNKAYALAKKAYKRDEIPVGCIIVCNDKIISTGYNRKQKCNNSLLHAEIIAINKACKKFGSWRLENCELYVTLEPCMMCIGAIIESKIKKVYYGTKNNNEQMYDNNKISKYVKMSNLNNKECSEILSNFFQNKRKK